MRHARPSRMIRGRRPTRRAGGASRFALARAADLSAFNLVNWRSGLELPETPHGLLNVIFAKTQELRKHTDSPPDRFVYVNRPEGSTCDNKKRQTDFSHWDRDAENLAPHRSPATIAETFERLRTDTR